MFGADERIYTQGQRHALLKAFNVIGGGPLPWTDGDVIIANCASYIAAQTARQRATPPFSPSLDMGLTIEQTINMPNPGASSTLPQPTTRKRYGRR